MNSAMPLAGPKVGSGEEKRGAAFVSLTMIDFKVMIRERLSREFKFHSLDPFLQGWCLMKGH